MEWISVKDKLPKNLEFVLVWSKLNIIDAAQYRPNDGYEHHDDFYTFTDNIEYEVEDDKIEYWTNLYDIKGPYEKSLNATMGWID
jgi:hypothetical protein